MSKSTAKQLADCRKIIAMLEQKIAALADPVPPAGGEELPATRTNFDYQHLGDDGYVAAQTWNECLKACTPIVTRLQAEVTEEKRLRACAQGSNAAWSMTVGLAETLLDDPSYQLHGLDWDYEHTIHGKIATLQSELTKARELWATEQAIKEQPGEDVLWQVLDAAVGVLTRRAAPHAWESEAFEAGRKIIMARREGLIATAPNQSAPADKGQGETVAIGTLRRDANERIVFDAIGDPHIKDGMPVYADQPAPAAVAMPDLSELREYHVKASRELTAYADDSGMRESDVKHYRKRAAVHQAFVADIDGLNP
jgi:hypothetical protein